MRERIKDRVRRLAAMIHDRLELPAGFGAAPGREICKAPEVGGPEVCASGMVVRRDRFQQCEPARRLAALYREGRGDDRPLNPRGQRRLRKPKRQFVGQVRGVIARPAQRQRLSR